MVDALSDDHQLTLIFRYDSYHTVIDLLQRDKDLTVLEVAPHWTDPELSIAVCAAVGA